MAILIIPFVPTIRSDVAPVRRHSVDGLKTRSRAAGSANVAGSIRLCFAKLPMPLLEDAKRFAEKRALTTIPNIPRARKDPVYGPDGPLLMVRKSTK
jgi:hypothetical protein